MEHTQGKWKVKQETPYGWHIGTDDTWVATVNNDHGGVPRLPNKEEGESNAALIVAAPELLEACKFLIEYAKFVKTFPEFWDSPEDDDILKQAQQAITKAEGK